MSSGKYASMEERLIWNTVQSDTNYYVDAHTGEKSYCWEWIGALNSAGYAYMTIRASRGRRKGVPVRKLAHRVSLITFMHRVLRGRHNTVLHLCNNQICIHPNHLRGGTQRKNVKQCVREGRHGNMYSSPVRDLQAR